MPIMNVYKSVLKEQIQALTVYQLSNRWISASESAISLL